MLRPLKAPGPPGPQDRAGALRRGAAAPGQRRWDGVQPGGLPDAPAFPGAEAGFFHDSGFGQWGVRPVWGNASEHVPGFSQAPGPVLRMTLYPRSSSSSGIPMFRMGSETP